MSGDDDWALTPAQERELTESLRAYVREQRWAALRMLWGRPIKSKPRDRQKGWTIYDGHVRNRDEDWTVWRGIAATVALIINRRQGQRQVDQHRSRTGKLYVPSFDLGYWDNRYDGYGCSYGCLRLYPGWRVEVASEGESFV